MKQKYLRLLSALFAVAMFASACGGSTTTSTTNAAAAAEETTDEAMDDDAMDDMSEDDHDDHGDDHDDHGDDHGDDDHDDHGDDDHDGEHAATLDVAADAPVPAVDIELTETDTAGTFDLVVELTNFTITPENVDGDPIDNEGHMHLLIDGVKVERFMDLERQVIVPGGEHLVEVELNANNHAAYAIDGEPIRAGLTVNGHGDSGDSTEAAASDSHDHNHAAASSGIEDGLAVGDENVSVSASYVNGSVELDGDDRLEAAVGDVVLIAIESDVTEQAHLHGYDILVDVAPGEAATILLTTDTPGKFEVEFEQSGTFIAELVVS